MSRRRPRGSGAGWGGSGSTLVGRWSSSDEDAAPAERESSLVGSWSSAGPGHGGAGLAAGSPPGASGATAGRRHRRATGARRTASAPGTPAAEGPGTPPGTAPQTAPRVRTRRRSRRQRVLVGAIVSVVVLLVLAGSVYGYLWWRLGQIKSEKCSACVAAADGAPYNVLIVGSDSRAGDTGQAARSFGSAAQVGGQRSDTIKLLHVDPAAGTAELLSIPRDTYVQLSGMPSGTGLDSDNKINTAFNSGPNPLIQTIENTFGIPISHFVVVDFSGVIDLVNSVGGIRLDFKYPVRDNDDGNNNAGLNIPSAGCQTLNGNMALALSRSRYYEYEVQPGVWQYDGSGDLGRIQRQNVIIEAVIDKAKSSYDPLTLNSFLGSLVHDITKDDAMSSGTIISLAQRYHAFSGSALKTFTLPTLGAYSSVAGDVEVVDEPAAQQVIQQFLGTSPNQVVTAPLDGDGSPVTVPPTTTAAPSTSGGAASAPTPAPGTGDFNPTPC